MKHLLFYLTLSFVTLSSYSTNVKIDTVENNLIHYKIYNDGGVVLEEAYWKNGKNVGLFKRYHEDGTLAQEFYFNESGRRVGVQKYYYENGKTRVVGNWEDGKIDGYLVRFHEKGYVAEVNVFKEGKINYNQDDLLVSEMNSQVPLRTREN